MRIARFSCLLPLLLQAAATWRLHDDTNLVGGGLLYSGSPNNAGCDTGEFANCPSRRLGCYVGGLYVNSVIENRLRTGPAPPETGGCNYSFPGIRNLKEVRWASHYSASLWVPEYRFVGRIYVYGIKAASLDAAVCP